MVSAFATMLLCWIVAGVASTVLFRTVGQVYYGLIQMCSKEGANAVIADLSAILPLALMVGVLSAILLLAAEKVRFALNHRMSRKEVLAEQQGNR